MTTAIIIAAIVFLAYANWREHRRLKASLEEWKRVRKIIERVCE